MTVKPLSPWWLLVLCCTVACAAETRDPDARGANQDVSTGGDAPSDAHGEDGDGAGDTAVDQDCGEAESCDTASCDPVAHCAGRTCGPDGCGGLCGTCSADQECTPRGLCACVDQALAACEGGALWWFDSCGAKTTILHGCSQGCVEGESTCAPATLDVRISASADDAEENRAGDSGNTVLTSTDLEMVTDGARAPQAVGLRFGNIPIPHGARVLAAHVQFKAAADGADDTSLTITGQAVDDAPFFTTDNWAISSRARTTATVAWAVVPWAVGDSGTAQRTPDLAAIVQEIVDRPGWSSGHAVALFVDGSSGTRSAVSFDGSSLTAPLLHVEYVEAAP